MNMKRRCWKKFTPWNIAPSSGDPAWALGIVTGNNQQFVLNRQAPGTEAIVRGSEVCRYYLGAPQSFLRFTPEAFQQTAPARFYRAPEKLIYKFIANKLVFAYDNRQL